MYENQAYEGHDANATYQTHKPEENLSIYEPRQRSIFECIEYKKFSDAVGATPDYVSAKRTSGEERGRKHLRERPRCFWSNTKRQSVIQTSIAKESASVARTSH